MKLIWHLHRTSKELVNCSDKLCRGPRRGTDRCAAYAVLHAPPAPHRDLARARCVPGSLGDLVIMLSILQDDFVRASDDWSADARARKRSLRKEREQTFQRIRVLLVRLGDRDQLSKLERLPFNERITALERYVANQPTARA